MSDSSSYFAGTLRQTNIAGWKMDPLKMHLLSKMWIFHCYVSLPEGRSLNTIWNAVNFSCYPLERRKNAHAEASAPPHAP